MGIVSQAVFTPPHRIRKDLSKIAGAARHFLMDFYDASQYAVAECYGLSLVSFDRDFDHTKNSRLGTIEILR